MLPDILSVIFPPKCVACRRLLMTGETGICLHCQTSLKRPSDIVSKAFSEKFLFPLACHYIHWRFIQHGRVQRIVHSIKYEGRRDLCEKIGKDIGFQVSGHFSGILVPVPQHPVRHLSRGFNQAEELARGISLTSGLSVDTGLLKRGGTWQSQTGRSRVKRLYALENSIYRTNKPISGSTILVDDVVTTGATLQTCAQRLLEGGASSVGIICLATV